MNRHRLNFSAMGSPRSYEQIIAKAKLRDEWHDRCLTYWRANNLSYGQAFSKEHLQALIDLRGDKSFSWTFQGLQDLYFFSAEIVTDNKLTNGEWI